MCKVLQISRSTYYYEAKEDKGKNKWDDQSLKNDITRIYKESKHNYGTRKIKKELEKEDKIVSRRRIGRMMNELGLISNYTVAQYKVHKTSVNNDKIENEVKREFNNRSHLE